MLLFESFNNIASICKKYGIKNYTINPDGTVDVNGHVYLISEGLTKSPLKFGKVTGNFVCTYNKLITLEGAPREVGGDFNCSYNQLTSLEGSPREVTGDFNCHNNPIYSVYKLFPDRKSYMDSLDYNYLRGTDIVKSRFKEACEEANIKIPNKINGYNYI
jgi:hypothetical protein